MADASPGGPRQSVMKQAGAAATIARKLTGQLKVLASTSPSIPLAPDDLQSGDVQQEVDYPGMRRSRIASVGCGPTLSTAGAPDKRRSIFKQELENNFEEEEKEWLTTSSSGQFFQVFVVLLFMFMDGVYPLCSAFALKDDSGVKNKPPDQEFIRATVLLSASVLSIFIGCSLALVLNGLAGLKQCFDYSNWIAYSPGAACFGIQQLLQLEALVHLGPATVMVLGNLGLPVSTLLRKFTLGRGQSMMQWNAVLLTTTTAIAFSFFKDAEKEMANCGNPGDGAEDKSGGSLKGVIFMFTATCFGCCGGLFMELMLKKTARDQPMYVQKVYIEFPQGACTLLIGLLRPVLAPQPSDKLLDGGVDRNSIIYRGFFVAWDYKVVLMMCVFCTLTWLITGIARTLDSIVKCIAQTASMVCVFLFGEIVGWTSSSSGLLLLSICVAQSSLTYAMSPRLPEPLLEELPQADVREPKLQEPSNKSGGADTTSSKGPLLAEGAAGTAEMREIQPKGQQW